MLEFLEDVLLPLSIGGHVGDGPQTDTVSSRRQRPDANPIPADVPLSRERRRQPQIFAVGNASARRLRQSVNRLRDFGRSREQPLDDLNAGRVFRGAHRSIGFVGVDDAPVAPCDEKPLARGVGDELRQIIVRDAAGELDQSDGVRAKKEDPGDSEDRQRQHSDARREIRRSQVIGGDRSDQRNDEGERQSHIRRPLAALYGRGSRPVGHLLTTRHISLSPSATAVLTLAS